MFLSINHIIYTIIALSPVVSAVSRTTADNATFAIDTFSNIGKREDKGNYGHVNVLLDAWTVVRVGEDSTSFFYNDQPSVIAAHVYNHNKDEKFDENLYLYSFDKPTGTDLKWYDRSYKMKKGINIKMAPTEEGGDRTLATVKVHGPGMNPECTWGDDDITATWL